ncbi:two-component regulator propeller domain-containing protein, partial [Sinomicrobium weinanense]
MKIHRFLSLLCLLGCVQHIVGQGVDHMPKDLKFKHFTSADGLSQRSVMAILQDKKGYLWFGTRDGLNKFDGNRFVVYKHTLGDTTSLSNNNVHSVYEDTYGNLWTGTQNGLSKYNPGQDNFVRYKYPNTQNTATDHITWEITQIDRDLLWVATNNGIIQVNIHTDEVTRLRKEGKDAPFLSNNNIRGFLRTDDGNLWICNTRHIDIYNPDQGTFRRVDYPRKQKADIHLNRPPALFVDSRNSIWLGYEEGLARYDPGSDTFVDFELHGNKAVTAAVRSICEDLSGNLWIGTYSGLYILHSGYSGLKHVMHDKNNATSLSQNSIYSITRDSRGDMWIGTWADGINYYNRDNDAFKNILSGNSTTQLNYKVVSGMAEDPDGNLWIGTEGGGLNFYNRKTGEFTYYKNDPDDKNSLSANNVKSVILDRNNNIWVGIHDGGVNFLDPRKKPLRFEEVDFPESGNISLKAYKVLTLLEDKKGNIWIGTLTGGLIRYDIQTKQLSRFDSDIRTVMDIVQTPNPDVLLVGGDNGLETINITTKKRSKIPIKKTSKKEPPLYINCIFIDNYNNYWIGTEGQGLFMYDPKLKKAEAYGTREGLPNDIIYGILPDDNGNIWISTNNGISRLNTGSNAVKNYYKSDGLQGNEFNYGSFLKTGNRELFFGGTNGLTYFNPSDIRRNTFVPEIDISHLEVNNSPYAIITDSVSKITLKHHENNFSIDFTALSYMQPEKNEFAYMLEGLDKTWNDAGNRKKAFYTNIGPGNYVFRVRGANNDGVWNEEGDSLNIGVLPAPWKTWWAYLLYAVFCIGIALYIRKLILLRIKEKKEKERLEEINRLKLRLFTDVSHDFRTPLTLIIGPLEKMIRKNSGDPYIREQHEIMYRNARMLLQLINQILDFRKSESGILFLRASKGNIVPFIADIKKSFDALAAKKNIEYQWIAEHKNIEVWFDKIKLKKILFNLLSNAFKFTDNDKIIIKVATTSKKQGAKPADYVKIDVINFGPVIPGNELRFIFDRFYQLDQGQKDPGSGIGLSLTKRLVELHKGKITVKSSEAKGTRFSVFLRLGNSHLSESERIDGAGNIGDYEFFIDTGTENTKPPERTAPAPSAEVYREGLPGLLIVEDNPDVQDFIKEIFEDSYRIFAAENGEQAISIAHDNPVDLIISDVSMPVMDGFELCDRIKTTLITSHIPVILLTA